MKKMLRTLVFTCIFAGSYIAPDFAHAASKAVQEAERFVQNLHNLQATFKQRNPDGKQLKGAIYLARHQGKMRIEYFPPSRQLLISNGTLFIHQDLMMGEITHLPLSRSPAAFLLEKNFSFTAKTAIREVRENDTRVTVILSPKPDNDLQFQSLKLSFAKNPMRLIGWTIKDVRGHNTIVVLKGQKYPTNLPGTLFMAQK